MLYDVKVKGGDRKMPTRTRRRLDVLGTATMRTGRGSADNRLLTRDTATAIAN